MKEIRESAVLIRERNIVEKRTIVNSVKHMIRHDSGLEVVVCDEMGVKRLKRIESFILPPHKAKSPCTVYFMKSTPQAGKWGGHICCRVPNADCEGEGYTVINLRADFLFTIERGDRFLVLFDKDKPFYDKHYIIEKLRAKIGRFIKGFAMEYVKRCSIADLLCNECNLSVELCGKLNDAVLYEYGVVFENLNLIIEKAM